MAAALVATNSGCASNDSHGQPTSSGGNGSPGAGAGGAGDDIAGGNGGDDADGVGGFGGGPGGVGGRNGGNGSGGAGGMSCAGETVKGETVPLDMYIMLDRSGSMLEKTGVGQGKPTKWSAVTAALDAFFTDPGSDGIGVGLQFFPVVAQNVPASCTDSQQCGDAGPCLLKTCDNIGYVVPCNVDAECGGGGHCVDLGHCTSNPGALCLPVGSDCNPGPMVDSCVKMTESICAQQDSCMAADYGNPAVEIAALGGAAAALGAAISATQPAGSTPTAPALQGAIDHASAWAAANPTHKVVAVLATDGLPTECNPQNINQIAQLAAAGQLAGISTFVIGVFADDDGVAQMNLDAIAAAGGTGNAFFITGADDVTTAFLEALHAIQGQTLTCDYQIPLPQGGSALDYGKVNVEYTPSGASMPETVPYVTTEAACDPTAGGWYYDVDPASGGVPTKILMCPATCSELTLVGGQIDIEVGCQTVIAEPK